MDELRATVTLALRPFLLLGAAAMLACAPSDGASRAERTGPSADAAVGGSPAAAPSPRPRSPAEALALFREGLVVPTMLAGGAPTRDALVGAFIRAVERRDTTAVRAMVIDRSEFAYFYYPSSPYTRPPTVQEAPLVWFLIIENSQKGVTRVFDRFAGRPLPYRGYRCAPEPDREGANVLWRDCVVALATDVDTSTRRLFGTIIERDGRFKFLTYANDF